MPKELVCTAPRTLEFRSYEEPALTEGQVRIKSQFGAAKHGTEMSLYKGVAHDRGAWDGALGVFHPSTDKEAKPFGAVSLGNMLVGSVIEIGPGVKHTAVGDRVLVYGGLRETIVKKEDGGHWGGYWKLPKNVAWQSAVLLDPADFAYAAVRDGHVRLGDAVAIFGLGAIGLVAIQFAKLSGATPIIAVDVLPKRLEVAQKLGATVALDSSKCDAGLEIKKATGGRGADVCIEYSGNWRAMQTALRGVAFGGNVVAGAYPPPYGAGLDLGAEAHMNVPNIIFSRACSEPLRDHPRWNNNRVYAQCVDLIFAGQLDGPTIVDPVVPFDKLLEEYPKIETDPNSNIKLGVKF